MRSSSNEITRFDAVSDDIRPIALPSVSSINWRLGLVMIMTGVLIAACVIKLPSYFVAIGMVALVLGFVMSRNLQVGMFAYICVAALIFGESPKVASPNSDYSAGLMPSELFLMFLTALWLGRSILVDRVKFVRSAVNAPLIAIAVVSIISFTANNLFYSTNGEMFHRLLITQFAEVGLLLCSVAAFFTALNVFKSEKLIQAVFIPVVILGLYVAVFGILDIEPPIPVKYSGLLQSSAIALLLARLLFKTQTRGQSIILGGLLVFMLVSAFRNTGWISGLVSTTVVLLVVSFYKSRAVAFGLIALILFALFVYPGMYRPIMGDSVARGDMDRFVIWKDAYNMAMDVNPLLGVGPGNYYAYIQNHATIWYGRNTYTTAHSNYMQMGAEMGAAGLIAFLWLVIAGVVAGNRAARAANPEMRWLAIAATAIMAGISISSFLGDYLLPSRGNSGLLSFSTTVYTWLILAAAIAGSQLPKRENSETE